MVTTATRPRHDCMRLDRRTILIRRTAEVARRSNRHRVVDVTNASVDITTRK